MTTKFKYKASWVACIDKYPYQSETSKKITIGYDSISNKTVSYLKETQDDKFCDTFEEAKQFLIEKHKRKIKEMEKALDFCKECLCVAESLSETDVRDFT